MPHNCSAVLFLIFNRPDLTANVFSEIRNAKPARLFIAADGPRDERVGEAELCEETRSLVSTIDWDCEIHRLYRENNLGCKAAVSSAISWFFEHVEEGIILEDDCLPTPSFFKFSSELLERYRNTPEIGIISGWIPFNPPPELNHSYYFSKYPHIWGWASWRRVWAKYDVNIESHKDTDSYLKDALPRPHVRHFWRKLFREVKAGNIDTWDFQLVHLCLTERLITVMPMTCLVKNIGFDERATHTISERLDQNLSLVKEIEFPLVHPSGIEINEELDRRDERDSWGLNPPSLKTSAKDYINGLKGRCGTFLRTVGLKRTESSQE